jgi:hypothetical protein
MLDSSERSPVGRSPPDTDTGGSADRYEARIVPQQFVSGGIVINVSALYWDGNVENILDTR